MVGMTRKCMPGLFITSTDTEVGKTHVAAMIARSLHAAGHRVGVYKPAASGCSRVDGQLVADDAVAVWQAAGRPGELEHVCVGTGPLATLDEYVSRSYTDGLDDRGGAMALWFAVEMARLESGV